MHILKLLPVLCFGRLPTASARVINTVVQHNSPNPDAQVPTYFPLHRTTEVVHGRKRPRAVYSGGSHLSQLHPTDQYGHNYHTPVMIGGKKFNLLLDTASSDTWVGASNVQCFTQDRTTPLPQSVCGFEDYYTPGKEFRPIPNQTFDIFYGSGDFARGEYGNADVELAGVKVNTQIAVVRSASGIPNGTSGILGLAYPDITFAFVGTNTNNTDLSTNQLPYNPIFTTMYKKRLVAPNFSVTFNRIDANARPGRNDPDGYLAFGGLPPVKTVGPTARSTILIPSKDIPNAYMNTTRPWPQYQWYTIMPDAFLLDHNVNNTAKQSCGHASCPCYETLPDSGGYLILLDGGATVANLPPPIADAIAAAFQPPAVYDEERDFYAVPCDAKAPSFAIRIGGIDFPVDRRDMIIDDETGRGLCMSGVGNGHNYPPYVVGGTFMKNVVTVFDVGANELRFTARGNY